METDDRDYAKCQKSKKGDMDGIFEFLMIIRTKYIIVIIFSLYSKGQKREGGGRNLQKLRFWVFRERVIDFSLRSWAIGPSDFFGARRKVVLRGEGNAWALILGSFDKLREVWVLSYLF